MYVITVEFVARSGCESAFRQHMIANASASRERESGCLQFDVDVDPADPATFFLYEIYTDRSAFDLHCASEHFLRFDAATREMVARKSVRVFERISPV